MPDPADFIGVVVAAGSSSRLAGPVPKQYAELAGRSLLRWSTEALAGHPAVRGVVVVLPRADARGRRGQRIARWPGVLSVVPGGDSRAESVRLGAAAIEAPFVLIHDAARPLASSALVDAVVQTTRKTGAAIPGLSVRDTVKRVDGAERIEETLDRSRIRLAQTPQGARREWLLEALDAATAAGVTVTDEAAALERAGRPVDVVPGDPDNAKITTSGDLDRARRMLGGPAGLRVGTGFDVHRTDPERPLYLGGLSFPGEPGLLGHSDADVVLHCAMDAVLGAAGLGDIGRHFPPDDPSFAGARSTDLAARVASLLEEAGYEIHNLDLTLLAERPRIGDRVEEMRGAVADSLAIDRGQVSVKATTLERLGALGREEGIACQAVALIGLRPRSG